ncbi:MULTISPECIES: DUF924 family protein [Psychrobacter]|uniref:DUF924 family protein n=1 Tax=Psychrobacter TaxID=497 RepID=UPI00146DBBE6|nr:MULTISPECIES: DUF924 family protein [Psychrobacter]
MTTAFNDFDGLTLPIFDHLESEARAVLEFWFDKDNQPFWFVKDDNFDSKIQEKFSAIWQKACLGECASWRRHHDIDSNQDDIARLNLAGRLAEILVLDQFSRNLNRNQAAAFTQDPMALILAQEAVCQQGFATLPVQWRKFIIMPMMHSESLVIHKNYLHLFEELDDPETLDFEHRHTAILKQFGRYPHRNAALGRKSSKAELEFLQQPNSSF